MTNKEIVNLDNPIIRQAEEDAQSYMFNSTQYSTQDMKKFKELVDAIKNLKFEVKNEN